MNSNESAVIVLIDKLTDSIVLTQRSAHLRNHPGQVCFPGGHWQIGDTDFSATALRELHEELGIEARRIRLIRKLTLAHTVTGTIIHPWLATILSLHPYTPNPLEVADVFAVPMKDVLTRSNYKDVAIEQNGVQITSLQFIASKHLVWGATARIMKQLCEEEIHNHLV